MKKIFLSAVIATTIFSVATAQQKKEATPTLSSQTEKDPVLDEYKTMGAGLPNLKIVDTLKNVYTEKDFEGKHNFFLFMFNPTCGHCIQMAKLMGDNHKAFKNIKIAFMAGPQMLPYLNSFYQATNIAKYPEIKVGVDSAYAIEKIYSYQMLPQLNIYDKDRKLIKIYYSDIPLDSLMKYNY